MPYYRECPRCHCNLDHGEICDCREEQKEPVVEPVRPVRRVMRPYDRVRAQVYATGNRCAIENFKATHG